ncbi:MAG TPA: WG repeat-containing protein, partial [Turneriella sp.]|nr:WG repeat-containing protein [Turneriella sp.]
KRLDFVNVFTAMRPMRKIAVALLFFTSFLNAKNITDYHKKQFDKVTFNRYGIAHIVTPQGWVAINKKNKVLYHPYIYDNGPDYVKEGLLRFVENGKMGFVDERGKKIIHAQFDFVAPFESGKAKYCIGCQKIQDGEHSRIDEKTGTWGYIDKKGKRISIN